MSLGDLGPERSMGAAGYHPAMNQAVQRYFAGRLSVARAGPPTFGVLEWRQQMLAGYGGAIEAFRATEVLTAEEASDWIHRMDAVLGLEPPSELLPPRSVGARTSSVGEGEPPLPEPTQSVPVSRFVGLVPVQAPDRPLPYGGRVQILAVERYDSRGAVVWRLAPLPDPEAQHREAILAHERDTLGLPADERKILRDLLVHRLVSPGAKDIALSDDLGTAYREVGGGSSGGRQEKVGRTNFIPAIPKSATAATVYWGDLEFSVALA
jgi:hypothetical protein